MSIEPLANDDAKKWCYDFLVKGDVLLAADRGDQYPCVVAEVPLDDTDATRFDLPKDSTIIMSPVDRTRAIDDPQDFFEINEVQFDLET